MELLFEAAGQKLYLGEADQLNALEDESISAVVCDPPYGLTQGKKGGTGVKSVNLNSPYGRSRITTGEGPGGFMGMKWDHGVPGVPFWTEALRVLKPGGHLLAFGGTRTHHRLMAAIEDAGFEIRDCLMWLTGQGFPKGLRFVTHIWRNTLKCLSNEYARAVIQVSRPIPVVSNGVRTPTALALARILPEDAPALIMETGRADGSNALMAISLSRSQEQEVLTALNMISSWRESSGVGYDEVSTFTTATGSETIIDARTLSFWTGLLTHEITTQVYETLPDGSQWPACSVINLSRGVKEKSNAIPILTVLGGATWNPVAKWSGWNVNLKPAWEPIVLARKPLSGTIAQTVLEHGTGGLNIDATRIGLGKDTPPKRAAQNHQQATRGKGHKNWRMAEINQSTPSGGRFPANLVLSHSEHCVEVGATQIKSDGHHPKTRKKGGLGTAGHKGQTDLEEQHSDGESVLVYACIPGCPVRLLGDQAGSRGASGQATGPTVGKLGTRGVFGGAAGLPDGSTPFYGGTGGPSRFFMTAPPTRFLYTSKASRKERTANGTVSNPHPTIKSLAVMRWLLKLVTPPGGVVLDQFCGSGSTLVAAAQEGITAIGVDNNDEYLMIALERLDAEEKLTKDND